MATVIYCDDFSEQLALGVHNFGSHTFKLALTNTAITTSVTNKAGITGEIAYTNISGGTNPTELERINDTLHKIEVDLRRELAVHDARISVVETKGAMYHPSTK